MHWPLLDVCDVGTPYRIYLQRDVQYKSSMTHCVFVSGFNVNANFWVNNYDLSIDSPAVEEDQEGHVILRKPGGELAYSTDATYYICEARELKQFKSFTHSENLQINTRAHTNVESPAYVQ